MRTLSWRVWHEFALDHIEMIAINVLGPKFCANIFIKKCFSFRQRFCTKKCFLHLNKVFYQLSLVSEILPLSACDSFLPTVAIEDCRDKFGRLTIMTSCSAFIRNLNLLTERQILAAHCCECRTAFNLKEGECAKLSQSGTAIIFFTLQFISTSSSWDISRQIDQNFVYLAATAEPTNAILPYEGACLCLRQNISGRISGTRS